MNVENLLENIESILECAQAIKDDAAHSPAEGHELYEKLRDGGHSIDYHEIVSALEIYEVAKEKDVACKYDAGNAFDLWEEWNESHLSDDWGDLYDVKACVDLHNEMVDCLSEESGLEPYDVRDGFREAIKALKEQSISPQEKALLIAIKTFIAATKE
jgi:hypothetical protein